MCSLMLETAFSGGAVERRKRSAEGTESALSADNNSSTDSYTLSERREGVKGVHRNLCTDCK